MRKLITMLMLLSGIGFGIASCSDDDDEVKIAAELTLTPSALTFNALGGSEEVVVATKAGSWNVTEDQTADWCTVEKAEGKFTVTVAEFSEKTDRTAKLQVTSGEEVKELVVTQKGVSATLELDAQKVDLTGFGTAVKVKVTGSADNWEAQAADDWCRLEKDGEYLVVRATLSETDRKTQVTVTLNDAKTVLEVNQTGQETAVGSLYLVNDQAVGVVLCKTDTTVYILSVKENYLPFTNPVIQDGQTYAYKMTIRTDTVKTDGKIATQMIYDDPDFEAHYPAAVWCKEQAEADGVDWYIPGYSESIVWNAIWDNFSELKGVLSGIGEPLATHIEVCMDNNHYWNTDPHEQLMNDHAFYWSSTCRYYSGDNYSEGIRVRDLIQKDYSDKSSGIDVALRLVARFDIITE